MTPTQMAVDTERFYDAATKCYALAANLNATFSREHGPLSDCSAMAGSYDSGLRWAKSYDSSVGEVLDLVNGIVSALESYGSVLTALGHNHELANHDANIAAGAEPNAPPMPPASPAMALKCPPSAGGPGEGIIDDGLGLLEKIGVPVPDGDSDKLARAADIWDRLAATVGVSELDAIVSLFDDLVSDEIEYIHEDLLQIRAAIGESFEVCADLSTSCRTHESTLRDLRNELHGILTDLAAEIAMTAAISIASSFISFGAGGAVGVAKATETVLRFANKIRDVIVASKGLALLRRGIKSTVDIAKRRNEMRRLEDLKEAEEIPRALSLEKVDSEFAYNTRSERLDHTFAEKHKLDGVVEKAGGREQAMREILEALRGEVPENGQFVAVVRVRGEDITVRGAVVTGEIKIGTAFIP